MSYEKAIKWGNKRPKGTKQPVLMHTDSGFWPSGALTRKWLAYAEPLDKEGLPYMDIETFYKTPSLKEKS